MRWIVITLIGTLPVAAAAAELKPRTSRAYDEYVNQARSAFTSRSRSMPSPAPATGVISVGPAREDGIVQLPGGLVHHWKASAFIRGVTLRQSLDVSTAFANYDDIYKAVIRSSLLGHSGDTYSVLIRLEEADAGIRAVLDVRSTVEYAYPGPGVALAASRADEIREVKNAGRQDERLLPAGNDSGYLWGAATFTYFQEHPDGVYVETESLGLSRKFPALLGWIIEPIARRIGRRSAATTLREFVTAVRKG